MSPAAAPRELEGLRTDQAPPLAIPASFFLLAPLAMIASGALFLVVGPAAFATRWAPSAMAATHLGTLGFLGAVMLGALYQMLPVVAGSPVPHVRLAHGVHALLAAGVVVLAAAFVTGELALFAAAPIVLAAAFLLFLVPVAVALARAPARGPTVWGMRLAVTGLGGLVVFGSVMALARAGLVDIGGDWIGWVGAHAALGGVVWIGGLFTAVSWQVVPMFYLTPPVPRWSQWATLGALALALVVVPSVVALGGGPLGVALGASPALVMVFWVHPVVMLRALHRRRRRRVDGSVRFWWAGLAAAPIVPVLAAGTLLGDDVRWAPALGWWVVYAWAGMVAHGMLTRIVPFLVWFHRYARHVGLRPVPSMRALYPDGRIRLGLALQASAVVAGAVAIATGWELATQGTGVLLAASGVVLVVTLIHTLRAPPVSASEGPTDRS